MTIRPTFKPSVRIRDRVPSLLGAEDRAMPFGSFSRGAPVGRAALISSVLRDVLEADVLLGSSRGRTGSWDAAVSTGFAAAVFSSDVFATAVSGGNSWSRSSSASGSPYRTFQAGFAANCPLDWFILADP